MDTAVKLDDMLDTWRFIGFYGHPEASKRKTSWGLLRHLSRQSKRPWLCIGDFNETLHHHEKYGGNRRAQWQIEDFRQCLSDCELHDLGFNGEVFTWCNKREEPNTIRARLNRACCSISWSDLFPTTRVVQGSSTTSDHGFLWIELVPREDTRSHLRHKLFWFEAAWTKAATCGDVVR
ncbi:UNVERIFIED_CONTAM: hypothetical protein Sradi_4000500 [Sesamum radiatum]|uniref:Uncharacterized protein n=1 Tax=Sesamum radiatum TaxID=300843 RepID=A0AAW2PMC9_SESRA